MVLPTSQYGPEKDVEKPTTEELDNYVNEVIETHNAKGYKDRSLWEIFVEEFEGFTLDTFKAMKVNTRGRLRRHLLQRGVYVGQVNRYNILSQALLEVAQQEQPHEWSDDDIKYAIETINGRMDS